MEMFGLIHYDLTFDNIIWNNDGSFIIIDFDDVAFYPFLADIAFAIDGIVKEETIVTNQILDWFSEGYNQIRSLPDDWMDQLENFFIIEKILKYVVNKIAYLGSDPVLVTQWLKEIKRRHASGQVETRNQFTLYWKNWDKTN
ncbi:MAG: phosphotransferase [Candidatus Heimdallarchaeota archaeon]|nr:phosphotransferase [Candidatus Heimdallarchaeota archaeon]